MTRSIIHPDARLYAGIAIAAVALFLGSAALTPAPESVQAPGVYEFQMDSTLIDAPRTVEGA